MTDSSKPTITLYTVGTPNGVKISILLEELGLKYNVEALSFAKNDQKAPSFLAINPNGRIPAITDTFTDGKPIRVFESGSIMQYLVDRYDPQHKLSYPPGSREAVEVASWLFFQNAGVGPMQGQANHFSRYAPEKIQYGIDRYRNETKRLYSTLDKHLAEKGTEYIVGDRCTIADIAHVGWAASADYAGVELGEFKALSAWLERMLKRPGVVRGRDVPEKQEPGLSAEERKRRADEQAKEGLKWIQQGMKDDAAKK